MTQLKDILHLYLGCEIFLPYNNTTLTMDSEWYDRIIRWGIREIKPVLRPLSDMTEEESLQEFPYRQHSTERSAEVTRYLLSKGFDLFGLIESGQAIDSTTLKARNNGID